MIKLVLLFMLIQATRQHRITEQPFFNFNDVYLAPIGLGNPTQLMFMALDPLSADFFVVDSRAKTWNSTRKGFNTRQVSQCFNLDNCYSKSPTFQETGMPFQVYYQGAYQNGRIGTEEFTAVISISLHYVVDCS